MMYDHGGSELDGWGGRSIFTAAGDGVSRGQNKGGENLNKPKPLPTLWSISPLKTIMPAELNHVVKEEKCHVEDGIVTSSSSAGDPLQRLLPKIENFTTTIPDAVLVDLMASTGFTSNDPAIVRLISLAAQKWLSGVTYDALQHCKVRTSNQSSKSHHGHNHGSDRRHDRRTLTMEDLTPALAEQSITIKKPAYYE